MMVKSTVTGKHPETNEEVIHEFEGEAICTVSVKHVENEGKMVVEVGNSIMGSMNGELAESMVEALMSACNEILKNVDPMLAALILAKGLRKHTEEGETDDMAGESGEPEGSSEQ